ncbi:hypothetical protein O0L34_g12269 [Tuta absoluta]|nr:hypothetical protein O0L34_g12269 [Tuta absoluta]
MTADSTTENEESATCFAKDATTCNGVLIENIIDDLAIKKEMIDEQMQDNIYNLESSNQIERHQSIKTKEEIKSESDNTETQEDQMISIIATQSGQSLGQYYDNSIKNEKNVLTAVHLGKISGGDQTDESENCDSIKTENHNVKEEQDIQKHDFVDNIKHESIIMEDKQEIKFENNGDDETETKTERKVKTEFVFLKEEPKLQDENNHNTEIKTEVTVLEKMQAFKCEQNESDPVIRNSEDIYNKTYKDEMKSENNVPEDAWAEQYENDKGVPDIAYFATCSGNNLFSALDNIKIVDCVSIAPKVEDPSLSCGIIETTNNDVFLDIAHQTDVLDQNEDTRNTLILIEDEQEHEQPFNDLFLNNVGEDNKKSKSEIEEVDSNLQEIIEDVNHKEGAMNDQFHDKIDEDEQKIPEDDNCKGVTIIVQSNLRIDKVVVEQEKEGTMNEQSYGRMNEVDIKQMITEGENLIVAMNRQAYGEMNEKDISPENFNSKEEAVNGRFDDILNGVKNKQKKEGTVTEQSNGKMDEKYIQQITEEYNDKVGAMNMNGQSNDEVDTQSGITEKENKEVAPNVHSSSRTEKVDVEKDNYQAGAISEQSFSIINAVNAKKYTSEVAAMNAHSNGEVNIQIETIADKNNGIRAINKHVKSKIDEEDIRLKTPDIVDDEVRNEEMHSDSKKNAEYDQKEIVDTDYDPVEGTNRPTDDKTDDVHIPDGNADESNDKIRTIINHTNSKMGNSDIQLDIIEILDDDDDGDVEEIETGNWQFNVDIKPEVIDITDDGFVPARNCY